MRRDALRSFSDGIGIPIPYFFLRLVFCLFENRGHGRFPRSTMRLHDRKTESVPSVLLGGSPALSRRLREVNFGGSKVCATLQERIAFRPHGRTSVRKQNCNGTELRVHLLHHEAAVAT